MGEKATICITAILMGSGLLAAYHSDSRQQAQRPSYQEQAPDYSYGAFIEETKETAM